MSNFEKIDDYLANRLPAGERASFEQALAGDEALRKEVAFQEKIVYAVQQARATELKQMLQQVPIPTGGWSTGQYAAGVIAVGVIATSLYFFFRPDAPLPAPAESPVVPEVVVKPEVTQPESKPETTTAPAEEPKKKSAVQLQQVTKPVQKPDIQVTDPSSELTETKGTETPAASAQRTELSVSKLHVITDATDKKYSFHYQFTEGKLHLFGPFDRNLYEILEINGDSHAVFLFYKENYYMLDEAQTAITPLTPIRDGQLLKKLREYRSR